MQACLGNAQLICNVSIAESVEAPGLHEALGDIQNLLRGVNGVGLLVHKVFPEIGRIGVLNE